MTIYEVYEQKLQRYEKGLLKEEEWKDFCEYVLDRLLEENKDILEFMKNEEW